MGYLKLEKFLLIIAYLLLSVRLPSTAQADLNTLLTQRITETLDAYNTLPNNPIYWQELDRVSNPTSAVIYLRPHDATTREPFPSVVDWAVAIWTGSDWLVTLPGEVYYTQQFNRVAPAVLARLNDSAYRVPADAELTAQANVIPYHFPWENEQWATVTRSYREHGTGRIDLDVSRNVITAAKDGVIIYANDSNNRTTYTSGAWWHWNLVVIQHAEHEFSLYGHLAQGGIPDNIRSACTIDYSTYNCSVPVQAGDVIGIEGNTGYSSNPHLHLELGQNFGIIPYLDPQMRTVFYTGYIYGRHNVGISGYRPGQVRQWTYGDVLQASHHPQLPGENVLLNPDFTERTAHWNPVGQISWTVQDEALHAFGLRSQDIAGFYQDIPYSINANTPILLQFEAENLSSLEKNIIVRIRNRYGVSYGVLACEFTLEPDQPRQTFTVTGISPSAWAIARFEILIQSLDSTPAIAFDHFHVSRNGPTSAVTRCTVAP